LLTVVVVGVIILNIMAKYAMIDDNANKKTRLKSLVLKEFKEIFDMIKNVPRGYIKKVSRNEL
jgi:hypothetical protein